MKKIFNNYLKAIKDLAHHLKSGTGLPYSNISGAVLLTIVILIVIVGLTGAAIYSFTTTTTFSQVGSQNAAQAYYLAESGFRVVASEYNQATAGNKNTVLENLHNTTLSLPGNAGQFDIRLYPHWFYASSAYTKGAATISVKVPGGIPLRNPVDPSSPQISFPTTGSLKLKGKTQLALITNSSISGDVITFNLNIAVSPPGFPYDIQIGEELFLVYEDNTTTSQTISQNSSITLPGSNTLAQILPAKKGSFRIYNENNDKMDYTYQERIPAVIDPTSPPTTISLTQIDHQNPADASVFPFQIDNTTEFYLGKNLAVYSTSTVGQGSMAGKKTVGDYTDVGLDAGFSTGKDTISFAEDIQDFSPKMGTGGTPILEGAADAPITVDATAKEIELGKNLTDRYGSVWYAGDTDIANCIQGRCDLGKGFNAYFEFQFDNTDNDSNSEAYGDGFTFAIISAIEEEGSPGTYRNTAEATGSGGEYLGYAGPGLGNGIKPPKIGVEFDTYPNPDGGDICSSGNRRDATPVANHAALVYWGEDTPGSFNTISSSNLLADGGGYLRIGSASPSNGDPEDWSSSQGTISFWFRRDTLRSSDRMWGQSTNMEMRFSGSDLVLDWGGNNSLVAGGNPFGTQEKWYFIAITWNESDPVNRLRLYYGDETTPPYLYASNSGWTQSVSSVGIIGNLFMNSSGGDENRNYIVNGKGADLRYYNTERTSFQILSDYNLRLSGGESNLRAYFPLQADLVDAGPLNLNAQPMGTTGWSAETPTVYTCGAASATYDDNRHGTGGAITPLNSLNSNTGSGDDGYHQVTKLIGDPNWLEDGQPHQFRIELIRPLQPSIDGVPGGTNFEYQIKIWIDCPACSEAELLDFPKLKEPFTAGEPLIQKTIFNGNQLVLNQTIHDELNKILFGFTEGTGGATQNVTLRNFELYFLKQHPPDLATW